MKKVETKTLGCSGLFYNQPTTLEELTSAGASVEVVCQRACDHDLYHLKLTTVRDNVAKELEKLTMVMRKTVQTQKRDGTAGKPKVVETEQDYIDRLIATDEVDQEQVNELVKAEWNKLMPDGKFAFTKVEQRSSKELDEAKAIGAVLLKDAGRLEKFVAQCEKFSVTLPDGATQDELAQAVLDLRAAIKHAADAEAGLA